MVRDINAGVFLIFEAYHIFMFYTEVDDREPHSLTVKWMLLPQVKHFVMSTQGYTIGFTPKQTHTNLFGSMTIESNFILSLKGTKNRAQNGSGLKFS